MDMLPFSHASASTTSPHNGWKPQSWSWVYYMGFCYVVEWLNDETQIQSVFQLLAHANGLSSGCFFYLQMKKVEHMKEKENELKEKEKKEKRYAKLLFALSKRLDKELWQRYSGHKRY